MGGAAAIPVSEILAYGLLHGYSRAELPVLWDAVTTVDNVWQQVNTKIQEAQDRERKKT